MSGTVSGESPAPLSRARLVGIYILKLAGTVLFLWWAISQIEDKTQLCHHFQTALKSPLWIGVGLALSGAAIFFGAWRWWILLRAQGIQIPFLYLIRLTLYGSLFNLVSLGGAAGDAMKIYCLIKKRPDKKIEVTLSVMVDHLVGFVATSFIFLIFAWGFQTVREIPGAGKGPFIVATLFLAGGLFFVALCFFLCTPRMMEFCNRRFPRFARKEWVQSTTRSMDVFRSNWRASIFAIPVSALLSLTFFLTFWAALRSLGQGASAAEVLAVMPLVDIMTALPISISGIGVRERTFDFLLGSLTSIPSAMAVAASLIGFLFHSFWGVIGGLAFITEPSRKSKADNHATS